MSTLKSKDTLEHYFVTSEKPQILWEEMKNLIKPINNRLWNLTPNTEILFRVLQTDRTSLTVNWANLILKYYIHLNDIQLKLYESYIFSSSLIQF